MEIAMETAMEIYGMDVASDHLQDQGGKTSLATRERGEESAGGFPIWKWIQKPIYIFLFVSIFIIIYAYTYISFYHLCWKKKLAMKLCGRNPWYKSYMQVIYSYI